MTSDAEAQTPGAFQVEHLTDGNGPATSAGEDAVHDIPLTLEYAVNAVTQRIDTALTSASCRAPYDLDLSNRTVSSAVVCEAGTVLRAGTGLVVVSPGSLTLRAGEQVQIQSGFGVQSGTFTAEIDPGLQP
jgi:hypothetical protein